MYCRHDTSGQAWEFDVLFGRRGFQRGVRTLQSREWKRNVAVVFGHLASHLGSVGQTVFRDCLLQNGPRIIQFEPLGC